LARLSSPVFFILLMLFVTTRSLFVDRFSLGGGELFALIAARKTWVDLLAFAVADIVHPPLFYILLKLWIAIGGESLLWLKLLAVVSGAAIIIPFLLICRTLRLQPAARNLALLFLTSNGYLVHYTQELRSYGLFASLTLVSLWLLLRYWATPTVLNRNLNALFVTNLLLIYTHYYGWLLIGLEFAFLALWRRQKLAGYTLSILILAVCFSPWAYLVVKEANRIGGLSRNLDWIPRPSLSRLASLYIDFNGPLGFRAINGLGLVLFGYPPLLMAWASFIPGWQAVRAQTGQPIGQATAFWILLLTAFLPCISLFLVSQRTLVALWIDRYFVFATVPYMLLVAMAIYHLRPGWLRQLTVVAVVVLSIWAGVRDIATNRMAWQGAELGSRMHWASLARQLSLSEASQSNGINIYTLPVYSEGLLTGDWAISTSLPFYLDTVPDERFRFVYAKDATALLSQLNGTHFWVAFFELGQRYVSLERALIQNGYRLGEPIVEGQGDNRLLLIPVWQD
jgi:uncharacterized membrane protein